MTPLTALELDFADGAYLFDLKLPQLAELQEKRGCGIFKLYGRVLKGRFLLDGVTIALANEGEAYAEDIFETIRLGLIGGGMDPREARKLVDRYCLERPLRETWAIAAAVLGARIEGYTPPTETEADKKKDEPEEDPTTSGSTSDESSPTAPSSEPTGVS